MPDLSEDPMIFMGLSSEDAPLQSSMGCINKIL